MTSVYIIIIGVLASVVLGGVYLGTLAAVAYTVFKALTKKR